MTKIVYNNCFGGFSVSEAALLRYAELKGVKLYPVGGDYGFTTYWTVPPEDQPKKLAGEDWYAASLEERGAYNKACATSTLSARNFARNDPLLVQVVEELGAAANGAHAALAIAEVPAGMKYRIDEYDGSESVMTPDDYEWEVA